MLVSEDDTISETLYTKSVFTQLIFWNDFIHIFVTVW
jgi:hypothetical protein